MIVASTQGAMLWDLWVARLGGPEPKDAKHAAFAPTRFNEEDGRFSPDGRWIAYVSNETGRDEVYVRRFNPDLTNGSASIGTSVLVSNGGGSSPRWRADGNELLFLAPGRDDDVGRGDVGGELRSATAGRALSNAPQRDLWRRDQGREAFPARRARNLAIYRGPQLDAQLTVAIPASGSNGKPRTCRMMPLLGNAHAATFMRRHSGTRWPHRFGTVSGHTSW